MKNQTEVGITIIASIVLMAGVFWLARWFHEDSNQRHLDSCNQQIELIQPEASWVTKNDCFIYHNGQIIEL